MVLPSINLPSTVTPMGYGVTAPGRLGPPSPLLADAIDPVTHDYVSLVHGVDPIDAKVVNVLKIARGSGAAVTATGNRFHELKKITEDLALTIESMVLEALARMIADGEIEYGGTVYDYWDPAGQFVQARVSWYNLRAADTAPRQTAVVVQRTV